MNDEIDNHLPSVTTHFNVHGNFLSGEPYGSGHINDTYCVRYNQAGTPVRYILQRINHAVFRQVPELMANISRVLAHQHAALAAGPDDASRRAMTLVPTRDGVTFLEAADGTYWRLYLFVEGARTHDTIEHAAMAEAAAAAFGRFQHRMASLPAPRLHETIPAFHDTPDRYRKLEVAAAADTAGRAAGVARELAFARARADEAGRLTRMLAAGELPERVTHNDTKLNNVMLDDRTGEGICVIDLDTVMPGLALYDFGDMVRSACNSAAEDTPDSGAVQFRLPLFEALARGYLGTAREFLTPAEMGQLAFAGRLMTLECGVRFLTDYLAGDTYFRCHRPNQNLDRCRVQFALMAEMERAARDMQAIIARYAS